jgi:hypothetical protein
VVGSCEDGNTRQVSQNFVLSSRATSGFIRRILLFGVRWLARYHKIVGLLASLFIDWLAS